jgi:hypothetical protein
VERTTIAWETEVLGENLPQRHFVPPQIPHDQVRFRTPDRSGGKPTTNRLSYGGASHSCSVSYVIRGCMIYEVGMMLLNKLRTSQ